MGKVGVFIVAILSALGGTADATGLSYEGELSSGGAPLDGWVDLRFKIFDGSDETGAKALGGEVLLPGVRVTNGIFRVEIDSGNDFGGRAEVWIEIGVKHAGSFGDFTTLRPRQLVQLPGSGALATKAATMPAGAVVFFNTGVCPGGWTEYVPARGRFVLGLPSGGTVGATFGTQLSNLEDRQHSHSISTWETTQMAGSHNHIWSTLFINPAGDRVWKSFNSSGSEIFLVNWTNGVGNEGSGYYPIAATPTRSFYTYYSGEHLHDVQISGSTGAVSSRLPYIQLLACRKN